MRKILILLYIIAIAGLFLRCGGGGGGSSSNDLNESKAGKFAVEKISQSNARSLSSKGLSKDIVSINGGTINASTTQYFILENVGQSDINNITMNVTDIDGNPISSGIKLSPGTITVLSPTSTSSIIQLVAIEVNHGTPEGASLGYTTTLSTSLTDTYFTIKGTTTTTDPDDTPVSITVDFKTVVNLAAWTISTDTNPILKNTGNVPITLGTEWSTTKAASAIDLARDGFPTLVLQPGESYTSGTHSLTMVGGHDSYLLTPLSPFSIYIGNTVCDYKSLSSDAIISSSGVVISYNY